MSNLHSILTMENIDKTSWTYSIKKKNFLNDIDYCRQTEMKNGVDPVRVPGFKSVRSGYWT